MSLTNPGNNIARCPYFNGSLPKSPNVDLNPQVTSENIGFGMVEDSLSISPFEPVNSSSLTKTCVSSAAKATMAALPAVAKAGCPHAG